MVFNGGGKAVNKSLVVYLRANDEGRNRLGLAVGKRVGNAVRRNRVKRLIRTAFRLQSPDLPQGYDLVCIPRPAGFPQKSAELLPIFKEAFLQALHNYERKAGK